jgi:hypothetical protein
MRSACAAVEIFASKRERERVRICALRLSVEALGSACESWPDPAMWMGMRRHEISVSQCLTRKICSGYVATCTRCWSCACYTCPSLICGSACEHTIAFSKCMLICVNCCSCRARAYVKPRCTSAYGSCCGRCQDHSDQHVVSSQL